MSLLVTLSIGTLVPGLARATVNDADSVTCEIELTPSVNLSWVAEMQKKALERSVLEQRVVDAVRTNGIDNVALNRSVLAKHNTTYSDQILKRRDAADQAGSGRCWIFSSADMLAMDFAQHKLVPPGFEFSENYLWFFHFIEQANSHFENIVRARDPSFGTGMLRQVGNYEAREGGHFEYFSYLVMKYGLVPKEAMPETSSSLNSKGLADALDDIIASHSDEMLGALTVMMRSPEVAKMSKVERRAYMTEELRNLKLDAMDDVWNVLATHLGDPPTEFTFDGPAIKATSGNVIRNNRWRTTWTPGGFRDYLGFDPKNYISVIASRNVPANRVFEVDPKWEAVTSPGDATLILRRMNSTPERMMQMVEASIKGGTPVVFTGDVSKDIYRPKAIMDPNLFARDAVYGGVASTREIESSRWGRQFYRLSTGNHMMLFIGTDRPDPQDSTDGLKKLEVLNSWGKSFGDEGRLHMYPDWFRLHVMEVVVPRRVLTPAEQGLWDAPATRLLHKWFY